MDVVEKAMLSGNVLVFAKGEHRMNVVQIVETDTATELAVEDTGPHRRGSTTPMIDEETIVIAIGIPGDAGFVEIGGMMKRTALGDMIGHRQDHHHREVTTGTDDPRRVADTSEMSPQLTENLILPGNPRIGNQKIGRRMVNDIRGVRDPVGCQRDPRRNQVRKYGRDSCRQKAAVKV